MNWSVNSGDFASALRPREYGISRKGAQRTRTFLSAPICADWFGDFSTWPDETGSCQSLYVLSGPDVRTIWFSHAGWVTHRKPRYADLPDQGMP